MSSHTPISPDIDVLDYVQRSWTVKPIEGIILGVRGRPIGYKDTEGYIYVRAFLTYTRVCTIRRTHLIWWKHNGIWPIQELDHGDRNKENDRIDNLKYASRSEQNLNRDWAHQQRAPYGSPWRP